MSDGDDSLQAGCVVVCLASESWHALQLFNKVARVFENWQ